MAASRSELLESCVLVIRFLPDERESRDRWLAAKLMLCRIVEDFSELRRFPWNRVECREGVYEDEHLALRLKTVDLTVCFSRRDLAKTMIRRAVAAGVPAIAREETYPVEVQRNDFLVLEKGSPLGSDAFVKSALPHLVHSLSTGMRLGIGRSFAVSDSWTLIEKPIC